MALDDTLTTATTRRTMVKTGVKLAYAAPLVAATLKLTSGGAGAVSQNCTCGSDCGDPDFDCFCLTTVDSNAFCSNNFFCGETDPCELNSDCPAGWICQGGRCPGSCGTVCVPPCGTLAADAGTGAVGGQTNRG